MFFLGGHARLVVGLALGARTESSPTFAAEMRSVAFGGPTTALNGTYLSLTGLFLFDRFDPVANLTRAIFAKGTFVARCMNTARTTLLGPFFGLFGQNGKRRDVQ